MMKKEERKKREKVWEGREVLWQLAEIPGALNCIGVGGEGAHSAARRPVEPRLLTARLLMPPHFVNLTEYRSLSLSLPD